ncbi:MAG: hypothetical protein KDA91_19165 [Planctomycetaceae bacterium]|nr:hypothetical protein [Planctomycetaceae bacterium]
MRYLSLMLAGCLLGNIVPSSNAQAPDNSASDERPADGMGYAYIDDDDRRSLADLGFRIDKEQSQNLKIRISATGANVEPIGGYRGIQGSNRYTAEELGLILSGQHIVRVVTEFDNGTVVTGRVLEGRWGRIPERKLGSDNRIDFLATTTEMFPLEITIDPQTQSTGLRRTIVMLNGRPRLRCLYNIVDGHIRNLEVQSLGGHGLLVQQKTLRHPHSELPMDDTAAGKTVLTSVETAREPVSRSEWNARDMEGRWALIANQVAQDSSTAGIWVEYLKQEKEFQLLEWMAIYIPDAFKSYGAGAALYELDAPQWIRVAAWHCNTAPYLGHGEQAAQSLLTAKPGLAEDWLARHKENIDVWSGAIDAYYKQFKSDKLARQDSSKYLPPLQPANVFAHLNSTDPVVDFGHRKTAVTGELYRHQFIREINGVPVSGRHNSDLRQSLRKLIRHADTNVRIAAILAHSYFLPSVTEMDRLQDFVTVIDSQEEEAAVREAALVAYSYHGHPQTILKLCQVAQDPDHPAWSGAVSRIGDIGGKFPLKVITSLEPEDLSEQQSKILADSVARIQERVSSRKIPSARSVARLIQLAVFAEQTGDRNSSLIHQLVISEAKLMPLESRESLRNELSLERLGEFWVPKDEESFIAAFDKLRMQVTE